MKFGMYIAFSSIFLFAFAFSASAITCPNPRVGRANLVWTENPNSPLSRIELNRDHVTLFGGKTPTNFSYDETTREWCAQDATPPEATRFCFKHDPSSSEQVLRNGKQQKVLISSAAGKKIAIVTVDASGALLIRDTNDAGEILSGSLRLTPASSHLDVSFRPCTNDRFSGCQGSTLRWNRPSLRGGFGINPTSPDANSTVDMNSRVGGGRQFTGSMCTGLTEVTNNRSATPAGTNRPSPSGAR